MSEETVVKSVRMSKKLAEQIEHHAKLENRNFSNMAETILLRHFPDLERRWIIDEADIITSRKRDLDS